MNGHPVSSIADPPHRMAIFQAAARPPRKNITDPRIADDAFGRLGDPTSLMLAR